ncbi:hypothetical protein [Polaribacter sp. Asnod6-C07]|uniref:hypothetical protein n=1 Tax=Polaribacter sp. Asnod6-C07 TaxID=3160582 RepID=UPI003866B6CE
MKEIIIKSIEDKLGWSERSFIKMSDKKADYLEIQDCFWSFLSSTQQVRFYFSKYIHHMNSDLSNKKKSELVKKNLDNWKKNSLIKEEVLSWNLLNELRNEDTHDESVITNYEIKDFKLSDGNGNLISDGRGVILSFGVSGYYVRYKNKDYEIIDLSKNGLESSKKLLEYLENKL